VIYFDSSVVLAELLMEDRRPPPGLWEEFAVSSALLRYEVWNRMHSRSLAKARADDIQLLLSKILLFDLRADVLERALHPFSVSLRTLDSLHLATMHYLRAQGREVALATYDRRLMAAAQALDFEAVPI